MHSQLSAKSLAFVCLPPPFRYPGALISNVEITNMMKTGGKILEKPVFVARFEN
jgi:hypothetical protein